MLFNVHPCDSVLVESTWDNYLHKLACGVSKPFPVVATNLHSVIIQRRDNTVKRASNNHIAKACGAHDYNVRDVSAPMKDATRILDLSARQVSRPHTSYDPAPNEK